MTDPNAPPPEREPVTHTTVINPPAERRGGNGWIGFVIGAVVVILVIIGFVVWSNGGGAVAPATKDVDVDINLPSPKMPDIPRPDVPDVNPPSIPAPATPPAAQ